MKFDKIKISPEEKGVILSLGIILFGNLAKPKCEDVGNFIQGVGIGAAAGTIAHIIDERHPNSFPHHDVVALASLPLTFIFDKTNVIKNKDISNNLYGIGIGVLSEHLLAEGCSICRNAYYCKQGQYLC